MSDKNMSRKSVLDRLNMNMLDDIEIVGEEVKESTDDSIMVMEKRTSTTNSIKVNLERSCVCTCGNMVTRPPISAIGNFRLMCLQHQYET